MPLNIGHPKFVHDKFCPKNVRTIYSFCTPHLTFTGTLWAGVQIVVLINEHDHDLQVDHRGEVGPQEHCTERNRLSHGQWRP